MVTRRPARAIGLGGKLGEITPGAHADLIAVPFNGPVSDVLAAVVENWTPIAWTMVDGRVLSAGEAA
jgi:imidazolonepropionase-like amidohydrolase